MVYYYYGIQGIDSNSSEADQNNARSQIMKQKGWTGTWSDFLAAYSPYGKAVDSLSKNGYYYKKDGNKEKAQVDRLP